MSEAFEKPRPRVMYWTRKFGEPLRQTFQADEQGQDEFFDLLAEADRRLGSENGAQSEGA